MKIIVTNISEGIAYYQELSDWVRSLDKDPDDSMFDALSLMEGDPDIIKYDGCRMYFIDIELNGTKYILTSDEVEEKAKEMLVQFYDPERNNYFKSSENNSWEDFKEAIEAIAYRGGQGYYYGINIYKSN